MKLSEPRKRALAVLLAQEQTNPHVKVRSSNRTTAPNAPPRTVYWKVAGWLIDNGLAERADRYNEELVLTDRGRAIAEWEDGR